MNTLQGQSVVVVGASSGIGLAVVRAAAESGANVIAMSRSLERLEQAAAGLRGSYQLLPLDMLDTTKVSSAFERFHPIDHLVLTAVADENKRRGPITELTDEQLERSLDKLRGFFTVVRAATPHLAERGSIVLTSGGSALKPPRQGMSVLAAVNASIIAFAHALSLELSPRRVNVITPGVVDTPVWAQADRDRVKQWAESAELPARRFGQPQDLAEAAIFLMRNPYVTGHNLVVDGGLTAT